MNKKYVVSRKLAKRMQKLGWKKKTAFGWYLTGNRKRKIWQLLSEYSDNSEALLEFYNAPLFAEIWEELPCEISDGYGFYNLKIIKNNNELLIVYVDEGYTKEEYEIYELKEIEKKNQNDITESAGEMWAWCKENGHIKERKDD